MTTGELIKQARISKGLTQKQLADKCHMADSAIRKYESGKVIPKLETRQRIATALNISTQELMSTSELNAEKFTQAVNLFLDEMHDRIAQENRLLSAYRSMNENGQRKAIDLVEDLSKVPEYKLKQESSAPSPVDALPAEEEPGAK